MSKSENPFKNLDNKEQILILKRLLEALEKNLHGYESVHEAISSLINSDAADAMYYAEVRECCECDKLITEGYYINGGDYVYCSSKCLAENYTDDEYRALCAGLDPYDEDDLEKVRSLTDEEFHDMSAGGDTYYTEFYVD